MKRLLVPGLWILLFVFLLVLLNNCYYDSEEYLYPSLNSQCDTTNVTFSVSVKNILSNNCLSCHSNSNSSAGGNIQLENYADVKSMADNGRLMGSVLHKSGYSPMPKNGGSLSDCDITILKKWIEAQTPNN
jgi:hypothetical protein